MKGRKQTRIHFCISMPESPSPQSDLSFFLQFQKGLQLALWWVYQSLGLRILPLLAPNGVGLI